MKCRPSTRQLIALPGFRALLLTYGLNQLTWSIGLVSLAALVYRRTGNAEGSAAFFLCAQFVPAALSPLAVSRAESRRPMRVVCGLYALEAALFVILGWIAGNAAVATILVLAVLDGLAANTARTMTQAATAGLLAPCGLLREGNALLNVFFSVAFMVGPALGGAIAAAGGVKYALLANGVVFILMTLATAVPPALRRIPPSELSEPRKLRAALGYVRTHTQIAHLMSVQAAALVFFTISIPVEVVLAERVLHSGAAGYGVLVSAWGAGAVAGSIVYSRLLRIGIRALLTVGCGALAVGFAVMGTAPTITVAAVGASICGIGNGIELVAARTALQEHVGQQWMGMVLSYNNSIAQLVPGVGILLGGVITATWTPRVALVVASFGSLAIVVAVQRLFRPVAEIAVAAPATAVPAER